MDSLDSVQSAQSAKSVKGINSVLTARRRERNSEREGGLSRFEEDVRLEAVVEPRAELEEEYSIVGIEEVLCEAKW